MSRIPLLTILVKTIQIRKTKSNTEKLYAVFFKSTSILQIQRWMRQIESFRRWKYFWTITKNALSMFLKYLNGAKLNYLPKHFMLALCKENPFSQTHSYVAGLFIHLASLPHNKIFSAHSFISMKEERKRWQSAHSAAL